MPIEINGNDVGSQVEANGIGEVVVNDSNTVYSAGPELGTPVALDPPNNSNSSTNTNGVYLTVNSEVAGVRCTIVDDATHGPQNYDYAVAVDGNGDRIGPEMDISDLSNGDTFDYMLDSPRSLDFGIGIGDSGGNHIRSRDEDASLPYTGDEFDVANGMYSEVPQLGQVVYNFIELIPILPE